jgi:hypothetical protein
MREYDRGSRGCNRGLVHLMLARWARSPPRGTAGKMPPYSREEPLAILCCIKALACTVLLNFDGMNI